MYGMSQNSVARPRSRGLLAYFTLRRALAQAGVVVYCLALFFVFDFAYSSLTMGEETQRGARVAHPIYNHGLATNFDRQKSSILAVD